jgi:predicted DNA-binding transcriptional regulator AlpA
MADKLLSFDDLVERGILKHRSTLQRWVAESGFPAGVLLGPNTRRWSEAEVNSWLAARPPATNECAAGTARVSVETRGKGGRAA